MRKWIAAILPLFAPLMALGAVPVVNSGTINYQTNQITLTGTGFQPAKAKPTVTFNGAALTVTTFNNTQVVATLPASMAPGTFDLVLTNSQGNAVDFNMNYGATGPQGPAGPAGAAGAQGPMGPAGADRRRDRADPTVRRAQPEPRAAGTEPVSSSETPITPLAAINQANNVVKPYNGSSRYIVDSAERPKPERAHPGSQSRLGSDGRRRGQVPAGPRSQQAPV